MLYINLMLSTNQKSTIGISQVVQWVRLHAPNAGGLGLTPGQGTRSQIHAATISPHATTKKHTCRNKDPVYHN